MFKFAELSQELFGRTDLVCTNEISNMNKEIEAIQKEILVTDLMNFVDEIFLIKMSESNKLLEEQISAEKARNEYDKKIIGAFCHVENSMRNLFPIILEITIKSQNRFFRNSFRSNFQDKYDKEYNRMENDLKETDIFYNNIDVVKEGKKLCNEIKEIKKHYKIRKDRLCENSRSLEQRFDETNKQMNKSIIDLVKMLIVEKNLHDTRAEIEKRKALSIKNKKLFTSLRKSTINSDEEEEEITFAKKLQILDCKNFKTLILEEIIEDSKRIDKSSELENVNAVKGNENIIFKAPTQKIKKVNQKKIKFLKQLVNYRAEKKEIDKKHSPSSALQLELSVQQSENAKPENINVKSDALSNKEDSFNQGFKFDKNNFDGVSVDLQPGGNEDSFKNFDKKFQKLQFEENKTNQVTVEPLQIQTPLKSIEVNYSSCKSTPNTKRKLIKDTESRRKIKSPKIFSPTCTENNQNLKRKTEDMSLSDLSIKKKANSTVVKGLILKSPKNISKPIHEFVPKVSVGEIQLDKKVSSDQLTNNSGSNKENKNETEQSVTANIPKPLQALNVLDFNFQFPDFLYSEGSVKSAKSSKEVNNSLGFLNFDLDDEEKENKDEPGSTINCDFFSLDQNSTGGSEGSGRHGFNFNNFEGFNP